PERDAVSSEGKKITYREHIYIMLNKPAGVVCATRDKLSETVLELIPEELRREGLFPAGRLDKDTVGFVLITDDGGFAHDILSPKKHVDKKYFAVLEKNITEHDIDLLKSGITIDGGEKCLPAEAVTAGKQNEIVLTLQEGKYHQVKRMAEALGNKVLYLKRINIGGLALDEKLKEGECREITAAELEILKKERKINAIL
ncbi:MAG: pseudouridine synthase, partial [Oscillospiraceae bacterium]|nr:pseudouridine synthase [Oscillospiraceae bacterium]